MCLRSRSSALSIIAVAVLTLVACSTLFNGRVFGSVYSVSQAVQRAFAGDLSRSRLSELIEVLGMEAATTSRQVRWPRERQVLAAYQEAFAAMRDYAVVWDLETRIGSELLPVADLPEALRATYGISSRQDFLPMFSSVEVMGQIGETVVRRLRDADAQLLAATGERGGAKR